MTEQVNTPYALEYFGRELDAIQDSTLQAFFYNAIAVAPDSFHADQDLQEQVKKTYHILRGILAARHVEGAVRDAMLGTVLLCDILQNEFKDEYASLHTVAVRGYLEERQVHKDLQRGLWENILRAIESHEGKGVSPILEAKSGTAEYEVANAFMIASLDYVKLDWEVIYSETVSKD